MKGIGDLFSQAKAMRGQMAGLQAQLRAKMVEAEAGRGRVKVVVNGEGDLQSIRIAPELIQAGNIQKIEELVLVAVNEGVRKSRKMMQKEVSQMAGGIPGLGKMLGGGL